MKQSRSLRRLARQANLVRRTLLNSLFAAGSGHPGGSLGMADVFTVLYFHSLRHDPKRPQWEKRDRVVLSNGHICPVLYASLALAGYFPVDELSTLRALGSRLQGHPHREMLPGLETTSGPLGSGLSQAVGMALGARLKKQKQTMFALTSDGEHQEGNHWEAVMLAAKYKLNHIIQIIDRNNIQIEGMTEDVLPLEPLADKYRSFGWDVFEVDGHDIAELIDTINTAQRAAQRPQVIIAHTIPGKGVSFMEGKFEWHGKAMSHEQYDQAQSELFAQLDTI